VEILAQSWADFALTQAYNFQGTHILGASRGHLSDSVIYLFSFLVDRITHRNFKKDNLHAHNWHDRAQSAANWRCLERSEAEIVIHYVIDDCVKMTRVRRSISCSWVVSWRGSIQGDERLMLPVQLQQLVETNDRVSSRLIPVTHAPETGAINRLHFLAPVFRTIFMRLEVKITNAGNRHGWKRRIFVIYN